MSKKKLSHMEILKNSMTKKEWGEYNRTHRKPPMPKSIKGPTKKDIQRKSERKIKQNGYQD